MDLLSPLSRLLGFSGTLSETSSSSQTRLDKSLPARAQGSTQVSTQRSAKGSTQGSTKVSTQLSTQVSTQVSTQRSTQRSTHAPSNISPSILTQTTRASTSEQNFLAQLRSLSPQALRSFISQRLPFLDDPRFVLALARAIGETQQAGRNSSGRLFSARNSSASTTANATEDNSPEQNKVKTSSESTAKAESAKPATSYQLRDRSGIIWRAWFLPIALDGRLDRVGIYHTRRRNRDSGKESDRDGKKYGKRGQEQNSSRLVFAIEFAHIGALEIEAEHSDGKLRMILRSTNSFSLDARAGIQAKFSEILQDLDLQGQLVFHKIDTLPMSSLSASEESLATTEYEYDEETQGMMTKVAHLDDNPSSDTDKTNWEIKL